MCSAPSSISRWCSRFAAAAWYSRAPASSSQAAGARRRRRDRAAPEARARIDPDRCALGTSAARSRLPPSASAATWSGGAQPPSTLVGLTSAFSSLDSVAADAGPAGVRPGTPAFRGLQARGDAHVQAVIEFGMIFPYLGFFSNEKFRQGRPSARQPRPAEPGTIGPCSGSIPDAMPILCSFGRLRPALQEQRSQSQALDPDAAAATPAGPRHRARRRRPRRPVRHPPAGRRPRRLRRAHDGARRRAQPGRAVLHLARRHDRHDVARRLHEAADRVRVRLLLDDNGTRAWTASWPRWTDIPTSKCVRGLFSWCWPKTLGYLTDFSRLNRRITSPSPPTTRPPSSAATSAMNISAPPTACCSPTWTCWRSARRCRTCPRFRPPLASATRPIRWRAVLRGGRAGCSRRADDMERFVRRRRLCRGHARPALHPSVAQGRAGTGMGAHAHGQRRSRKTWAPRRQRLQGASVAIECRPGPQEPGTRVSAKWPAPACGAC